MGMALPKEVGKALEQTSSMADDLKAIKALIQRLVELEEDKH